MGAAVNSRAGTKDLGESGEGGSVTLDTEHRDVDLAVRAD